MNAEQNERITGITPGSLTGEFESTTYG